MVPDPKAGVPDFSRVPALVEQTIYVQVTLHREGGFSDVALVVPLIVELPGDPDAPLDIDAVLEDAQEEAKALLRPFLNNQAYFDTATPAIPQSTNRWRTK